MPSSPLGSTHDRTTSGVAYHHRPWIAYMVRRRRAWHAIFTLDKIYGRTFSGVEFHHIPWTTHTVERRRAWHAIISFGHHTQSNDVECGIPLSPLGSTHGRTTSVMACHYSFKAAQTVERCQAWHDITALGLYACSDDVGRGMTSPP